MEIHTVAAGRGAAWLFEAWDYFKNNAGVWIGIGLILLVSVFIPLVNMIAQILAPVFLAGLLLGCREIANGGKLNINHLFAGFSQYMGNLILIVVFNLAGMILIGIFVFFMVFILFGMELLNVIMEGTPPDITGDNFLIGILILLIGMMLYLPLMMAYWFAPALVVLNGCSAVNAMKYSFIGCLRNFVPLLIYGLVGLVLIVLASIPFLLGWFILMPMIIASIYISYVDIYAANPQIDTEVQA